MTQTIRVMQYYEGSIPSPSTINLREDTEVVKRDGL